MNYLLIKMAPKKDINVYKNNINATFNLGKSLITKTEKTLNLLEMVPKQANWQAVRTNDILRDEAATTEQYALGMRSLINSHQFRDAILDIWNLNDQLMTNQHNASIENHSKDQFYQQLRKGVENLNNIEPVESLRESNFEMAEALLFAQKSLIQINYDIQLFRDTLDMPKGVSLSMNRLLNKVQDDIVNEIKLEQHKMVSQEIWKKGARNPENSKRYINKP